MSVLERILGDIEGGSVLDVATQQGHFAYILKEHLKSYTEILGIDINKEAIESAQNIYGQGNVYFLVMDAEQLSFKRECFDTVTISASLHHLSNIPRVLAEMVRVLKPGGHFIIAEMHRDGQTQAQLTSVYLHHWVAEVDSALDHLHNRTLACQEFANYVADLKLHDIRFYHDRYLDSHPKEPDRVAQLDDLIERTIKRADRANNAQELKERGKQLRQRLHKIGAQREPIIIITGMK